MIQSGNMNTEHEHAVNWRSLVGNFGSRGSENIMKYVYAGNKGVYCTLKSAWVEVICLGKCMGTWKIPLCHSQSIWAGHAAPRLLIPHRSVEASHRVVFVTAIHHVYVAATGDIINSFM